MVTSFTGRTCSLAFLAWRFLRHFVRRWLCSTMPGPYCWGWNLNNMSWALMLNLMVSTQTLIRALTPLKNGVDGKKWQRSDLAWTAGLTACDMRSDRLSPSPSRIRVFSRFKICKRISLRGKTSTPYKYKGPWPIEDRYPIVQSNCLLLFLKP